MSTKPAWRRRLRRHTGEYYAAVKKDEAALSRESSRVLTSFCVEASAKQERERKENRWVCLWLLKQPRESVQDRGHRAGAQSPEKRKSLCVFSN